MKKITKLGAVSALSLIIGASAAFAENIKITFIDPLSGPFATTGTNGAAEWTFAADELAWCPLRCKNEGSRSMSASSSEADGQMH
jgi:hypothetical protein